MKENMEIQKLMNLCEKLPEINHAYILNCNFCELIPTTLLTD